jgi:hypothetical protein
VAALDSSTVWIAGDGGTVLRTTNKGTTWKSLSVGTKADLFAMSFVDKNHGWIVGDSGVVLRYHGDPDVHVKDISNVASDIVTVNAFPNPFNSMVTISVEVPDTRSISLEAYDLLGRKVATIAEGAVQSGRTTFQWYPVSCASGLYMVSYDDGKNVVYNRVIYLR